MVFLYVILRYSCVSCPLLHFGSLISVPKGTVFGIGDKEKTLKKRIFHAVLCTWKMRFRYVGLFLPVLFHGNALCQIAWLVDIFAFAHGDMICQQLEWYGGDERLEAG